MSPHHQHGEPITVPDGEALITEPDGVMLPLSVSSMSDEDGSPWAELPLRVPPSTDSVPTRKVPTPSA